MKKEKKKLSKRTILLAALLVILLGVPAIIYLITSNQEEGRSWYSSSWMYRKSVTVSGNGSTTLTNEDILLTIDTSTLIGQGKLQSDCDDLRFTDSNDSTLLTYWIEAGCYTTTTQVWVRIPSLPAGGKTIYMYYGNSSATSGQASWSGNFIMLYNSSCPSGWTSISGAGQTYNARFPYGSTSYGTTGGGAHNHGTPSCTTGTALQGSILTQSDSGGTTSSVSHTHTNAMVSVNNVTNLPPYLDMVFCTKSSLDINIGLITVATSVPSGWTAFSALNSRFPRGAATYGGTGGAATHTHPTTGGYTTGAAATSGDTPGTDKGACPHTHTTASGTTDSASSYPPYIYTYFVSKNAGGVAHAGLITMTTAAPPLGWTRFTGYDSRFPLGTTSYGTTGGASTHQHTLTITTNLGPGSNCSEGNRATSTVPSSHSHSCTTTAASGSTLPQYVTTLYYQRKTSLAGTLNSEEVFNQAPTAPTSLLTEGYTNPIPVSDLTPEFSAIFNDPDTSDTGNYYQIQVNTNSSFTGTVMWDSGKTAISPITRGARSTDISYAGTALSHNGTIYYWRIKFWDQNTVNSEGVWSATANFTMNSAPTAPTSLLTEGLTNPTKVTDATPEFSAIFKDPNLYDTGIYYQILVNDSDSPGDYSWDSGKIAISAITNGKRSTDISYAGETLYFDGNTYDWQIRFWDNADAVSVYSATGQFTMNNQPNQPSSMLTEGLTNPTKVSDLTPEFSAIYTDPDGDALGHYEIEVNTNNTFTGTVMWDSGQTAMSLASGNRTSDISYAGTALTFNGTVYYWRMRFWDSAGTPGAWTWPYPSFQMSGSPNVPTDLSVDGDPTPTAFIASAIPKFQARHSDPNGDSAIYYEIEVNSNSSFTGTVKWDSGKQSMTSTSSGNLSPELSYAGTALSSNGTTYYWRIRFWDTDDNVSDWSATASFVDQFQYFRFEGLKLEGLKIN